MNKIIMCIVCILLIFSLTGCQSGITGATTFEEVNEISPSQEDNPVQKMDMPTGTDHKNECY